MYQHARLATAWTCRHYNTTRLTVLYNLFLSSRQLSEKLAIFGRSNVAVDFIHTIALKVLADKLAIVHLKIVVHVLQGSVIVADHQIGVFAHYMYLLNLLLIEFIERTIVVLLIA